jgi:parallel beta helix pectate lyase-like protein
MRHFRYMFLTAVIMFLSVASTGQAAVSHRDSGTHRKGAQVHHSKAKTAKHHRKAKAAKHHRKAKGPTATKASAPVQTRRMPLVVSAAVPVVSGTTYYVSASGSDSNSGTSPAQAWQTVGRVNRQSLAPGDAVLFAGGQTFSDSDLEPATSGTAAHSIVFGSFGQGDAVLPKGAWFVHDYLLFDHLRFASTFFGGSAVKGPSNHITVQNCQFSLPAGNQQLGLYANGTDWTIQNNVVQNTGLSGMLLNGDGYHVVGNTIDNVGLYDAGYNAHGIYLDASDATITDNTITRFSESAVSARYRSSTIERNYMSGGQIGIDFYQTDANAGTSHWLDNTITNTTTVGIYVSSDGDFPLHESFVIQSNAINSSPVLTNLRAATTGTYTVSNNV